MKPRAPDRPRGAAHWARQWRVHRETARRILRHLHAHYGATVVWEAGPQRALVATDASLQVVRVLRKRGVLSLAVDAPEVEAVPERYATRAELESAVREIKDAIKKWASGKTGAR